MKLFLFTVSAFVASVSMVAADVSMAGYGRFGLYYNEGSTGNNSRLDQRFRLNITGTTETDTGIKLKGIIRFQTDDGPRGRSNVAQRSAA
ncbi:MAG TPA: porin, partial [Rhodobacteraceae bacterium]|nr:porin [Paracoccaceae bacterium]